MTENRQKRMNQNFIYEGNKYWNEEITEGLVRQKKAVKNLWIYPEIPGSLYESLTRTARLWPEKICLIDDDGEECTYAGFLKLVNGFSSFLSRQYQIRPGEHVGVLLYNSIEYCVCIYALNRLGAVMVPFSTKYKRQETESLIAKADLSGIIFHQDFAEWFREEDKNGFRICLDREQMKFCMHLTGLQSRKPEPEDEAIMMFTSGTTSRSKGVMLRNYNIMHAVAVYQKIFCITQQDTTVLPVPAYHITGLVAVIGLFVQAGGCIRLHKFFSADRVLREMQEHKVTFFHASPTVFSMLLEKKEKYPAITELRTLACGSGNMPISKIKELKKWIPSMKFHTVYGLTETSSPATIFPGDAAEGKHQGSAGCVVPGLEIKIGDTEDTVFGNCKIGTILIRGTSVTEGYYKREDIHLTDGWLDTGDLGYFDEDGYLYIADRKKDMINRGGEKVCSYDVENAMYGIKGIKDAAVVGIPDEVYGEVPAAMVVPEKDQILKEEDIRRYLKTRLAKFQIPAVIVFTGSLPLTPNMKTDKNKIRQLLKEEKHETS